LKKTTFDLIKISKSTMKLLIRGAKQIVQVVSNGDQFLTGVQMKKLATIQSEEGLSIVVDK